MKLSSLHDLFLILVTTRHLLLAAQIYTASEAEQSQQQSNGGRACTNGMFHLCAFAYYGERHPHIYTNHVSVNELNTVLRESQISPTIQSKWLYIQIYIYKARLSSSRMQTRYQTGQLHRDTSNIYLQYVAHNNNIFIIYAGSHIGILRQTESYLNCSVTERQAKAKTFKKDTHTQR